MPLFDLKGRVCLVTGASKGIGRGIAERLAEHGARVVISSRNQKDCAKVAGELNAHYGKGEAIAFAAAADLRDLSSLDAMVARVLKHWGRIDTLVCNAAVMGYHGASIDTPDAAFQDLLTSNIFHYFKLCHMVAPQMKARRDGAIIFIGSGAGLMATPEVLAYAVAKAGEAHLARCLAAEFAPFNVRVNCISPGLIRSEASRPIWEDAQRLRDNAAFIPLQRMGEPDEIAAAVIFLAGPGGGFTTGITIPIDGGAAALGHANPQKTEELVRAFTAQGGFSSDHKQ